MKVATAIEKRLSARSWRNRLRLELYYNRPLDLPTILSYRGDEGKRYVDRETIRVRMSKIWRKGISTITTELIVLVCFYLSARYVAAEELRWVGANECRLIVSITPGQLPWKTTPVSTEMDLGEIEKAVDLSAVEMNLDSIRVVAYDARGEVLVYDFAKKGKEKFYIPYRIRKDDFPARLVVS